MKFSTVVLSSLLAAGAIAAPKPAPQGITRSVNIGGQPQPTQNWGGNGGGRPPNNGGNWGGNNGGGNGGGNDGGRPPPRPTPTSTKKTTTTTKKTTTSTKKPTPPPVVTKTTTKTTPKPTQQPAPTGDAPNADQVYIQSVGYGGSGCPQGSASVNIMDRNTRVTVIFQSYEASAGPGITASEGRRNCQINVNLHYPGGFQYSTWSSDYRGYVSLDPGVKAVQAATYYFSGETAQASTSSEIMGPRDGNYLVHDEVPFTSTIWSPCGRVAALNINSQVRVDNSGNKQGQGLIVNDSMDGKVEFVVGVKWQKCRA